ncbi:glycosyltransferase [Methylococcus geothermalis]|uniref:Glycosyltransferase n=2 Tax=Methylococcus geothermalis TaxID=2681310 RepID=A0A858QCD9_9GAMM|nr:glycosyltransferase [Methylococcus geothermalis]
MGQYFERFEERPAPEPLPWSLWRESLYQYLATVALVLGAWYLAWRWSSSLNERALWLSVPLAFAESCAYLAWALLAFNLWRIADRPSRPAPYWISECVSDLAAPHRPLAVDVCVATCDEDAALVRLSLEDAKKLNYPYPIDIRLHLYDAARRPAMKQLAESLEVAYLVPEEQDGLGTHNLRRIVEQTQGDFIVFCDADTRLFPSFLEHTLGYFRDPDVAWVQTPHWYCDIPEGAPLGDVLGRRFGPTGFALGRAFEAVAGPVRVGRDPFGSDPSLFFGVIQRRRNRADAAYSCGAGAVYRSDALMDAVDLARARRVGKEVGRLAKGISDQECRADFVETVTRQAAADAGVAPYHLRESEHFYASVVLHGCRDRNWSSVLHPRIESKMLSPQSPRDAVVRRFRRTLGLQEIALRDNPVVSRGLSLTQRLMYAQTLWSSFGCLWHSAFLLAPMVFLYTGIAPVEAYSSAFFSHLLPFLLAAELAMMVGTWGVPCFRQRAASLALLPVDLHALWSVLRGRRFPAASRSNRARDLSRLAEFRIAATALTLGGMFFALARLMFGSHADPGGLLANGMWGLYNVVLLSGTVSLSARSVPIESSDTQEAQA